MNHIVLVHPAIPQNTGNIMRTCVATNTSLHIIKPMSFELDDKKMKRAGLDYIKDLDLHVYESYEEFKAKNPGEYHFFTRYSKLCYTDQDYSDSSKEHYLFFGHEHDGIPKEILKENLDRCVRIPMSDKVRSLNLSNCAALTIYEVLRQQDYPNLSKVEVQKGTIEEGHAKKQLKDSTVVSHTAMGEAINEVKSGQVDAVDLEKPVAEGYVAQNSDLALASVALKVDDGDAKAVAMAKGNERLKEVVNKVVKKLKADGTYDEYIKDASKYTAVE